MKLQGKVENIGGYVGIQLTHTDEFLSNVFEVVSSLTPDYVEWINNQKTRDHGRYHVTMIPYFEKKSLTQTQKKILPIGKEVQVHIKGYGKIVQGNAVTVYAVVDVPFINDCRSMLGLNAIYPHITIAFNPHDIHGVNKDESTIFTQ